MADAIDVVHDVKAVSRVTGDSRDTRFLIALVRAAETFRNVCVHLPTQVLAFSDREFAEEESEVEYDVQARARAAPCRVACQEGRASFSNVQEGAVPRYPPVQGSFGAIRKSEGNSERSQEAAQIPDPRLAARHEVLEVFPRFPLGHQHLDSIMRRLIGRISRERALELPLVAPMPEVRERALSERCWAQVEIVDLKGCAKNFLYERPCQIRMLLSDNARASPEEV